MREVVLFGNGLGRAVDNDYFQLAIGLQDAWSDEAILTPAMKTLIRQCIATEDVLEDLEELTPQQEHELDTLQQVVAACDLIKGIDRRGGEGWLTDHGLSFPGAIRSFIHRTACYFHRCPSTLPEGFVKPLIEHLVSNRSHIATLNYDDLLYRALINSQAVFNGYSYMIDGFNGPFDEDNLNRWSPQRQSYYLHLHGSPLFVTDGQGRIRKKALSSIAAIAGHESIHLVLTAVQHKPTIIASSPLLIAYWARLR